jgi:hypothetical protein
MKKLLTTPTTLYTETDPINEQLILPGAGDGTTSWTGPLDLGGLLSSLYVDCICELSVFRVLGLFRGYKQLLFI